MKRLLALLILVAAVPSWGATVEVNIPNNLVAPLQEVCTEIQRINRWESFTDAECATYLVRLGALTWRVEKAKVVARAAQKDAVREAMQAEVDLVNTHWPLPDPVECGNGVVENVPALNHVEECDDGNTAAGDGCSPTCMNE